MTKCAFRKEWPASGHGKDIQVEPLLHIEVEGAVRADVAPDERRQARRSAGIMRAIQAGSASTRCSISVFT